MVGEDKLLDLLRDGLNGDEADGFEGYVTASRSAYTRLANAEVIQDSVVDDTQVVVRAVVDNKLGVVTTNELTVEGLRRARMRAAEFARSAAGKPFEVGFAAPVDGPAPIGSSFDDETASIESSQRHQYLAPPLAFAKKVGVLLAGNCHTGAVETAIWNSNGVSKYARATRAEANLIALDGLQAGDSTGYSGQLASSISNLGLPRMADEAIDKVVMGRDPVDLEPKAFDVVLEPAAVSGLLEWMSYIGFSSEANDNKMSFMVDRLGDQITGDLVTLVDDPLADGVVSVPFDVEGTTKQRLVLVERGVAQAVAYDRETGRKAGCASTGHAVLGGGMMSGAVPAHIRMEGGNQGSQELVSAVEDGLLVTRFHYVNGMLEPRRAVMTGLTRDGTFLIRDGKLVRGVRNLRFTDSVLEAFSRIEGVSATLRTLGTWWSSLGSVTAPTILIRGLEFTGKTS